MALLSRSIFLSGVAALVAAPLRFVAQALIQLDADAYVFCRPGGAPLPSPFGYAGHVGFAYRVDATDFIVGSMEMAHGDIRSGHNDFFAYSSTDPIGDMATRNNICDPVTEQCPGFLQRYDFFKKVGVSRHRADLATAAIAEIDNWNYSAPFKDCLDVVRKVLSAYGATFEGRLEKTVFPNEFFDLLPGEAHAIGMPWPDSVYDASFYEGNDRKGNRDDIVSGQNAQEGVFELDISFDPTTSTLPNPDWSYFFVRRGFLWLYSEPNFNRRRGHPTHQPSLLVRAGEAIDIKEHGWTAAPGSYLLTPNYVTEPPPGAQPRFGSEEERSQYLRLMNYTR